MTKRPTPRTKKDPREEKLRSIFGKPRIPINPDLKRFLAEIENQGFLASGRGWPSFFCLHLQTEKFFFVQVLSKRSRRLRRAQKYLMQRLAANGIDCRIWSPDGGFEPVVKAASKPRYVDLKQYEATRRSGPK